MKTGDITLVFKELQALDVGNGLVMEANEQSIAIVKREDKRGIYFSINDKINNIPQKPHHFECAMTLLLLNRDRFKYSRYNTTIRRFK